MSLAKPDDVLTDYSFVCLCFAGQLRHVGHIVTCLWAVLSLVRK